jgi:hypothetical protein
LQEMGYWDGGEYAGVEGREKVGRYCYNNSKNNNFKFSSNLA